jgi:toxin ParE1/3/4
MNDLYAAREYAAVTLTVYAERLVNRLIARTDMLASFPEAGRVIPEFNEPAVRELPERSFRIVYRVISSTRVDIIRIHPAALPLPEAL